MTRRSFFAGAMIALAATSAATALAQDKTYKLAAQYKKGEERKSKITINASLMGMELVVVQNMKLVVKEIKDNGNVVIENIMLGGTISINGMEQEQPARPAVTEERTKTGKLLELKTPAEAGEVFSPEVQKLLASINDPVYSDKEVKVGDSWTIELDNPVVKDKKVKISNKVLAAEKVGDIETVKVGQKVEAVVAADGTMLTQEMTFWINPENGEAVKAEGKIANLPTSFGNISWTMKMAQVK
jgi:hypothetical protein